MEVFQVQGNIIMSVTFSFFAFLFYQAELYLACGVRLAPDHEEILLCKL
jgi:hypothetical protein